MKALLPFTLLASAALAASSSSLQTVRFTIISTIPCKASSSTFFPYSNSSIPTTSTTSLSQSSGQSIIYQDETEYENETVSEIHTVCDSYSQCSVTTEVHSYTTYTTTVDGILTVITTEIPSSSAESERSESSSIWSEEATETWSEYSSVVASEDAAVISSTEIAPIHTTATETEISTTVVSVQSCSGGICTVSYPQTIAPNSPSPSPVANEVQSAVEAPANQEVTTETETDFYTTVITQVTCSDGTCTSAPVTTGVQIITQEETVYTTYCPLSSESSLSSSLSSSESSRPRPAPTTTINVITNNIITEIPTTSTFSGVIAAIAASNSTSQLFGGPETTSHPELSIYTGGVGLHSVEITGVLSIIISFMMFI
ncbi:uncharacterized protein J8A68_000485 [[Candida] subhashii]|uniref:Uncharacterized protein n=1 Tax=[Candida] subhashii TaxID=561895 RepID=A0A8J5R745_9ASCO|nr:uncharacterized protein J8A68_000485 [[Candida] subhashii]KAG7666055.1 hypothetical protein J8A68_000485 [[Candida] subhashii]